MTFKANPNYYLPDVPKVETLVWRAIPEAAARVAALQTGQIDIALRIPPHQVAALERDTNIADLVRAVDAHLLHRLQQPDDGQGHADHGSRASGRP